MTIRIGHYVYGTSSSREVGVLTGYHDSREAVLELIAERVCPGDRVSTDEFGIDVDTPGGALAIFTWEED